ncbi:MAG: amidohydrolase family protein [Christensenellales bacterium]
MVLKRTQERLQEFIADAKVMDTHEHLPAFEHMRNKQADVLSEFLSHYFIRDLISAGFPPAHAKRIEAPLDIGEKWKLVEPYWAACRYTGYGQSLAIAAKDLYGIDEIDRNSIHELNERFLCGLRGAHYQEVLKKRCRIEKSVLDAVVFGEEGLKPPDGAYFIQSNRIDRMVLPRSQEDIAFLERIAGIRIARFDDYLQACAGLMERFAQKSGILKCALAYERSLSFEKTSYGEAEAGFCRMFRDDYFNTIGDGYGLWANTDMQNYVMHFLLGIAQEKEMVLQVHTGIQEGNGNLLRNSDPLLLNELIQSYPGVKFDLFHIGYPFHQQLGVLAKWYPNVWADMCWSHIISPDAAQAVLKEWLEAIPYNKILGFGGDYLFADGVYGHLCIAKNNIVQALMQKIEKGLFDAAAAEVIITSLLYEAPAKLYGLAGKCG